MKRCKLPASTDRWLALERPSQTDPAKMETYAIQCTWCGHVVASHDTVYGFVKLGLNPNAAIIVTGVAGLLHTITCYKPVAV